MPDLDTKLLARVLGRMQSEHDNETLIAARIAVRMVRQAGTTWDAVVANDVFRFDSDDSIATGQVIAHPRRGPLAPPVGRTWKISVNWLCQRRSGVDDRENEFLDRLSTTLEQQNETMTPPWITAPQAAWVTDIYERIARGP